MSQPDSKHYRKSTFQDLQNALVYLILLHLLFSPSLTLPVKETKYLFLQRRKVTWNLFRKIHKTQLGNYRHVQQSVNKEAGIPVQDKHTERLSVILIV